jgi:predicted DNA-binding transcriptional regulator YafY
MVIRRCMSIIRCAQRGPASREELIQAMLRAENPDDDGDPEDERALQARLEKDLQRIRERLLIDLYFDPQAGGYVIEDTWLPLLDLPDEDLATIAWLEQTFGHETPKHDEVHAFLGRLRLYLDPERVRLIEEARTALEMDLRQRDEDEIQPGVYTDLTKAFVSRRQVELVYLSPQYEDGQLRRHIVEPYEPYYFDATRGHYYLRAYCRRVEGPEGVERPHTYYTYRLGRIQALRVLPKKLSPIAPRPPRYEVVYRLAPEIARLGVTRHPEIEVQEVERREDGSAVVRGETESVFWTVRRLLHYGAKCEVLGGPEVRWEMRKVVGEMGELYREEGQGNRI